KGNEKSKNNRYQYLFEEILKQKKYDEQKLIAKLGYSANPNGFSVAKNYLYQLLLRCLRNYNNNSRSAQMQVAELLIDVEILYRKGLFKNCFKLLQKGIRIATKFDLTIYHLTLLRWETQLSYYLNETVELSKKYESLFSERQQLLQAVTNESGLECQYLDARVNGELDCDSPTLGQLEKDNITIRARYAFYSFRDIHYRSNRQGEQGYRSNLEAMEYFEKIPAFRENYKELHLEIIYNYLKSMLVTNRFDQFAQEHQRLLTFKVPPPHHHLKLLKDCLVMNLLSTYHTYKGQFSRVIDEILPQYNHYLQRRIKVRFLKREIWTMGMISWTLLALKRREESFEWLMMAEQDIDRNIHEDQYLLFRFLALALHFELENFRLMESINKSLQRFMDLRNKDNAVEINFLKFSRKVANPSIDRAVRMKALRKLRADLLSIDIEVMRESTIKVFSLVNWINRNLGDDPRRYYNLDDLPDQP
ncbi:MAG: hypothetical protein AAGG75_17275, partial [Bacteroidota bacterium]